MKVLFYIFILFLTGALTWETEEEKRLEDLLNNAIEKYNRNKKDNTLRRIFNGRSFYNCDGVNMKIENILYLFDKTKDDFNITVELVEQKDFVLQKFRMDIEYVKLDYETYDVYFVFLINQISSFQQVLC